MVLYRDHKGGLDESMATTREIATKQALADDVLPWINQHSAKQYTVDDIELEFYGYDPRIEWGCWIVTIKGFGVIGFTNGPLPE